MTDKPKPEHVQADLENLFSDFCFLSTLPKPAAQETIRRAPTNDYGHPAQWASVNLTRIATILWTFHGAVAQQRNETPPPPRRAHERVRVLKAWAYLKYRVEDLIDAVAPEDLKEMGRLHASINTDLGFSERKSISSQERQRIDQVKSTLDAILRN